jgi:hypothetical protein
MSAHDKQTAILQIGSGFKHKPKNITDHGALSLVDQARQAMTKQLWQPGRIVYLTGQVPWDRSNPVLTLANLNQEALVAGGLSHRDIVQLPGLNAFSDAWNVTRVARESGKTRLIVVSSDFYFAAYEEMWRMAGRRHGLDVGIVSLDHGHQVSREVWDFYRGIKAQMLAAVAANNTAGHWLAKTLADRLTARRATEGFKHDGHTTIG